MKKSLLFASLLFVPILAFASTSQYSPAFIHFANQLYAFGTGAWGVGIATTLLLLGAAVGVAHCGPGATLAGVAGAAVLRWGPMLFMWALGIPVPSQAGSAGSQTAVVQVAATPAATAGTAASAAAAR